MDLLSEPTAWFCRLYIDPGSGTAPLFTSEEVKARRTAALYLSL